MYFLSFVFLLFLSPSLQRAAVPPRLASIVEEEEEEEDDDVLRGRRRRRPKKDGVPHRKKQKVRAKEGSKVKEGCGEMHLITVSGAGSAVRDH